MTDTAWIDAALTSARPQAVGALLRYFRNLDTAEEAFQNASLRSVVAAVVGNSRATGPSRPCFVSLSCTTASFFITAASCSLVQEPTVSSSW